MFSLCLECHLEYGKHGRRKLAAKDCLPSSHGVVSSFVGPAQQHKHPLCPPLPQSRSTSFNNNAGLLMIILLPGLCSSLRRLNDELRTVILLLLLRPIRYPKQRCALSHLCINSVLPNTETFNISRKVMRSLKIKPCPKSAKKDQEPPFHPSMGVLIPSPLMSHTHAIARLPFDPNALLTAKDKLEYLPDYAIETFPLEQQAIHHAGQIIVVREMAELKLAEVHANRLRNLPEVKLNIFRNSKVKQMHDFVYWRKTLGWTGSSIDNE